MNDIKADEIDLIELLQILWDGKWVIAGASAAGLAIGGTYVALTPNSFDASITIQPLNAAAIDQFHSLNSEIEDLNGATSARGAEITAQPSLPYLSSRAALSEFVEVLLQRDTIVQAADQNEMLAMNSVANRPLAAALRSYAFGIDISPVETSAPSSIDSANEVRAWRVTWTAQNEAKSNAFISDVLSLTNEATRQRLHRRFITVAERIELENSRIASQIELEIENIIENYRVSLNDQLAYLAEQASLAQVLGIGVDGGPMNSHVTVVSNGEDLSGSMSYLNGYQALQEQLRILSSREQVEAFVPGLRNLQAEFRRLEQDQTANQLIEALEHSPLTDIETFRAAHYDLASIETTYHKSSKSILALSLILGGLLGATAALVRKAMDARRAEPLIEDKSSTLSD